MAIVAIQTKKRDRPTKCKSNRMASRANCKNGRVAMQSEFANKDEMKIVNAKAKTVAIISAKRICTCPSLHLL
jgi:hypothetical protein